MWTIFAVALVASTDPGPQFDFTSVFSYVQYGVLGVVLLAIILGYLWAKPSVDRLIEERNRLVEERDRVMDQRDAMATMLQEKIIPTIGDFSHTTQALLPLLQQLVPVLQDAVRAKEIADAVQAQSRTPRRRATGGSS